MKAALCGVGDWLARHVRSLGGFRQLGMLDFQRMIRDSGKRLFDTVLVWKLDRFARNRYDSAHYKSLLKKNGVRVVSATEHITEGPEGIILESMLEGMAAAFE